MKVNYRFYNALILGLIMLALQQTKLFTIQITYIALMLISTLLMICILLKRPFIYKLSIIIDNLIDYKDIKIYKYVLNKIFIITLILLLCHFPLMLVLNKVIIHQLLIITIILFLLSNSLILFYLLISIKSFAYSPPNYNIHFLSISYNLNQGFKYFLSISYNLNQGFKYLSINNKPDKSLLSNIHNNYITYEERSQFPIVEKDAILKEIYLPRDVRLYVPLFIIIDKLFIIRDKENNNISNELFKLLTILSGGKHGSIKKTFNILKDDISLINIIKSIKKAIYNNNMSQINNFDKYKRIALLLLDGFNSSYFKIPKNKSDEFVIICVLYFTVLVDGNNSPNIKEMFDEDKCKSLLSDLKNKIV